MARITTKGKCKFCQKEFSKAWMGKHLATCPVRMAEEIVSSPVEKPDKPVTKFFDLLVEGRYAPMYWMYLKMPITATLSDLDSFLRDEWLECCGHLSAFRIGEDSYTSMVDELWGMDDKNMVGVKLGKVLKVGDQLTHEYDFGTTTELKLKVIAEGEKVAGKGKVNRVEVLARNDAPEIPCQNCGALATQVCAQCIYEGEGWLCDKCAGEHECDEDMFLPILNSPRVGMCGYGA